MLVIFVNRTIGTVNNRKASYRSFTRNKISAPRTQRQHSVSSVFFFFFYLVWWHLTLITPSPETPWHCPNHTISTALLSGSCVSYRVGAHAWSNEPQSVSRFFAEMRLSLWHEPYAEETVPSYYLETRYSAVTWDERSEKEKKKRRIVK